MITALTSSRTARRVRNWLFPGAVGLLYHRVIELDADPQWLCVPPRYFAEHLQVLRDHFHPLALEELVQRMGAGSVPRRAVVVTFDDGYADNLLAAKPLLETHDVPAMVFVATGQLAGEREFWWDELERLLFEPASLPQTLALTISGREFHWNLDAQAIPTEPSNARETRWNVASRSSPTVQHKIYREVAAAIKTADVTNREATLEELARWAGLRRVVRETHRTMRPLELGQLAAGGLVGIGAHTMTHSALSSQSVDAQRVEVNASKSVLEEHLGRPVTTFSYPFGGLSDYTADTVNLVREAGFSCACSNFEGHIRAGTDRFQIPRFLVRDWPGEEFQQRLLRWFND